MKQNLSAITDDYKNLAAVYEDRWARFMMPVRQWVMRELDRDINNEPDIIDMGCGTGAVLKAVHDQNKDAHLTGVDISQDMLDVAEKKFGAADNVKWVRSDLENFDEGQGCYDIVICLFVYHHIQDQTAFLDRLIQLAKPGGKIVIADYALDSIVMWIAEIYWRFFLPSHTKALSSKNLARHVRRRSGIEIVAQKRFAPDWFWRQQGYILIRK